ncbi:MAG: hypothetical protein M1816_000627 [Peltula sp. TS41687]|nr:MAG: hypothetical protein M1816_000627 [Peltula sp. TS41687]
MGKGGRGAKVLQEFALQNNDDFSGRILKHAVEDFRRLKAKVRDILWFAEFRQIVFPDGTDLHDVPSHIAASRAFYKWTSEVPDPDPASLKSQALQRLEYGSTSYASSPKAILHAGCYVELIHKDCDRG